MTESKKSNPITLRCAWCGCFASWLHWWNGHMVCSSCEPENLAC